LKRSNRLILLFGVALAVVAFVGVLAIGSPGNSGQPQEPETVSVVVAASDLALGTQLTAEMLSTDQRPVPQAVGTFATPDELVGQVVRRTVSAGQVLRDTDFQGDAQQAEIATSIAPGLRGIAVALDKVGGVGYLVQPGDRVDVVLSTDQDNTPVTVPNPLYPGESNEPLILLDDWVNNISVKVLVQNVQVVGMIRPTVTETGDPAYDAANEPAQVVAVLAVTPQQVELIRFAQQTGSISVVMRSPYDSTAGDVPTSGITLRELVEQFGVLPPTPVQP
jgi:pilus assembly protein CpaB